MLLTSYHNKLKKRLFDFIDEAIVLFNQIEKPDLIRMKFLDENKIEYFINFEDEELLKYFNIRGIEFFISVFGDDYFGLSQLTHNYWDGERLVGNYDDIIHYFNYSFSSFNLIISDYDKDIADFIFFDLLEKYNLCGVKIFSSDGKCIKNLSYYTIFNSYPVEFYDEYEYYDYSEIYYYQMYLDGELDNEFDKIYNKKDFHRRKIIEYSKQRRREQLLKK